MQAVFAFNPKISSGEWEDVGLKCFKSNESDISSHLSCRMPEIKESPHLGLVFERQKL